VIATETYLSRMFLQFSQFHGVWEFVDSDS
jgi:hypothetical protein